MPKFIRAEVSGSNYVFSAIKKPYKIVRSFSTRGLYPCDPFKKKFIEFLSEALFRRVIKNHASNFQQRLLTFEIVANRHS